MKIYTNDLVKGHSDFKVKCLTFGLYTQVSDSGPLGPLVHGPVILLNISITILWIYITLWILVQYDTMSELILFIGQCELYLMVQ